MKARKLQPNPTVAAPLFPKTKHINTQKNKKVKDRQDQHSILEYFFKFGVSDVNMSYSFY